MEEISLNIVRTTDIIGKSVFDISKEKLGKIEEIVLEKVSGRSRYIVLSFDTFMGFGGKYFALPWESISYSEDFNGFILAITKDKLEDKQGFDNDNWPDMAQTEWQERVRGYYGTTFSRGEQI